MFHMFFFLFYFDEKMLDIVMVCEVEHETRLECISSLVLNKKKNL